VYVEGETERGGAEVEREEEGDDDRVEEDEEEAEEEPGGSKLSNTFFNTGLDIHAYKHTHTHS